MDLMGNTSDDADDQWNTSGDSPHAETVTVTLTQNPGEGESCCVKMVLASWKRKQGNR